jgi:ribonucleoside-diphosphate reductase beta chain
MEGNAKIIKLIARDENVHLASTQQLIKILPKEDADFARIQEETKDVCIRLFTEVVEQEKAWARYLFKDGSMIGLNEKLLCDYVEWIADKRMKAIGLNSTYKVGSNPLPWTQRWIAGSDVQVAPQETQISSYLTGSVKQDVTQDSFKGFSL